MVVAQDARRPDRLEGERDVARRLEPQRRGLLEASPHEPLEAGRDRGDAPREVGRVVRQDRDHRVGGRGTGEGGASREELEENGSEREDVGPAVHGFSSDLLRRHVVDGPDDEPRGGLLHPGGDRVSRLRRAWSGPPREAEVEDLRAPLGGDDDVRGLQVPVDDPFSWAAASASAICAPRIAVSLDETGPYTRRCLRLSPSMSSMTM